MSYKNPYDNPMHVHHVQALGFCDSIHRSKAWCNRYSGHSGKHWSPGKEKADLYWDGRSEHLKDMK